MNVQTNSPFLSSPSNRMQASACFVQARAEEGAQMQRHTFRGPQLTAASRMMSTWAQANTMGSVSSLQMKMMQLQMQMRMVLLQEQMLEMEQEMQQTMYSGCHSFGMPNSGSSSPFSYGNSPYQGGETPFAFQGDSLGASFAAPSLPPLPWQPTNIAQLGSNGGSMQWAGTGAAGGNVLQLGGQNGRNQQVVFGNNSTNAYQIGGSCDDDQRAYFGDGNNNSLQMAAGGDKLAVFGEGDNNARQISDGTGSERIVAGGGTNHFRQDDAAVQIIDADGNSHNEQNGGKLQIARTGSGTNNQNSQGGVQISVTGAGGTSNQKGGTCELSVVGKNGTSNQTLTRDGKVAETDLTAGGTAHLTSENPDGALVAKAGPGAAEVVGNGGRDNFASLEGGGAKVVHLTTRGNNNCRLSVGGGDATTSASYTLDCDPGAQNNTVVAGLSKGTNTVDINGGLRNNEYLVGLNGQTDTVRIHTQGDSTNILDFSKTKINPDGTHNVSVDGSGKVSVKLSAAEKKTVSVRDRDGKLLWGSGKGAQVTVPNGSSIQSDD